MTRNGKLYIRICSALAARACHNSGQSIDRIARSAKKSPSTIRRWIALTKS